MVVRDVMQAVRQLVGFAGSLERRRDLAEHHDAPNGNRLRACRRSTTRARHPTLVTQCAAPVQGMLETLTGGVWVVRVKGSRGCVRNAERPTVGCDKGYTTGGEQGR